MKLARSHNLKHLVHEVIWVGLGLNVSDCRLQAQPLFLPVQPALSQQNQPRMQLYIQQFQEIGRVGRHHSHLMPQGKSPNNMVRLARQSNMGDCLGENTHLSQSYCQEWRKMLVKQQT